MRCFHAGVAMGSVVAQKPKSILLTSGTLAPLQSLATGTITAPSLHHHCTSLRELGLEHTFSANKFSTMWLQKLSMGYARAQAESILCLIGKNSDGTGPMHMHGAGENVD